MDVLDIAFAPAALERLPSLPVGSNFRLLGFAIYHMASRHPGLSDQVRSFLSRSREFIASICYWNTEA